MNIFDQYLNKIKKILLDLSKIKQKINFKSKIIIVEASICLVLTEDLSKYFGIYTTLKIERKTINICEGPKIFRSLMIFYQLILWGLWQ